MPRPTPTLLLIANLLACDALTAAEPPPAALPVVAESPPTEPPSPPARPPLQLPITLDDCDGPPPAHTLTASEGRLDLDGTPYPGIAALVTALAGLPGGESLALAFDGGMTRKQLAPLLAAIARLTAPPRLLVRVDSVDPLVGVRHVPIAGIAMEAPDDPARPPAYLLALSGARVRWYDLVDSSSEVPDDVALAGLSVLVTASDYTSWDSIAAGLARVCGGGLLVEMVRPDGTRVPMVTRSGVVGAHARPQGPTIDRDMVRRIVRAHIDEVRGCYDAARVRDPQIKGRVAIRFTIGKTGKVTAAAVDVDGTKFADAEVGPCLAAAVRRWTFPRPERGDITITYPFVLEPG